MKLLLKDLLNMGEARLREGKCLDPRLDAELLFSYMVGKDKAWIFLHYGDELDEKTCDEFFRLVDIRAQGLPLQHITGSQEFMGLNFKVNENVLIPRQDTEILVEKALDLIEDKNRRKRKLQILDLCCGSGIIAISLAHYLTRRRIKTNILASDISKEALLLAQENSIGNKVARQIRFIEGDLFSPFPKNRRGKGKLQFDFILSNPPYIPSNDISTLMVEVRDHEPLIALDGGPDGLDFYRRILGEAHHYLAKGGIIIFEIGYNQGEALAGLVEKAQAYNLIEILGDYSGNHRLVILKRRDNDL